MRYEKLAEAFQEASRGFTAQEAVTEASRCIKCDDAPCSKGCPAGVDVSKFIRRIASKNLGGAIRAIKEDNILAGVCARICPQGVLCEQRCSSTELATPIQIGRLQRFAADQELEKGPKPLKSMPDKGTSVAVIGSGPAGLSAATFLKRLGYDVDLFEADVYPGGVLTYGIPPYRLPKHVVENEIDFIRSLGVRIHTEQPVETPTDLLNQYRAVFLGTGASRPYRLAVKGENLSGVIQALDLLREVNLSLIERRDCDLHPQGKVVVIGGGNAAMDAAVTARLMGAERVTVLYRRSEQEMPAWEEERRFAQDRGVEIRTLTNPIAFAGEGGRLAGARCVSMELGEEDDSGRRHPIPIPGSEFTIPCETAIIAVGQGPGPGFEGLESDGRGLVIVDEETLVTSVPGLYAGGDLVRGSDTAVQAVGDGKKAAFAIDAWIQESQ